MENTLKSLAVVVKCILVKEQTFFPPITITIKKIFAKLISQKWKVETPFNEFS